ncbi:MAG: InlB B-repeat-containing protein [Eubacteriales bacterium]
MKHPAALFFTLFFLLAMLLSSITASSASTTPELYDLNSGEEINISKVTAVLDVLSGVGSSSEAVDYNGDGKTDITDVTALLNILAGLVPEEPQSYGLEYTLENGYYVVTGIGTCTDQDIILPNTYDGKPVKAIGQGAFERTEITSIIISSSVTAIEDDAFYRCSALKTVTMTSSITSVGDYAFDRCSALIEVHFDGTKTQWTAIRIGESNEELANATVYYEGIALIEFIDYDESVFDIEEVRIGGSVSAPPEAPHRTNYRFVGWSINGELLPSDFSITVEDNLTIKAVYIRQYTVQFLDHDGTVLKTDTVEEGRSATAPVEPTRDGYTFTGWDKEFNNITSDLTVTAVYRQNSTVPTVMVSSTTASAGDTVEIHVKIQNNPGIAGAKFVISYDSKLALTAATNGEAFSALDYTEPASLASPCPFNWDSLDAESNVDGVFLILTFTVDDSVVVGDELNIVVSYDLGYVYDADLNDVTLDLVCGKITIK